LILTDIESFSLALAFSGGLQMGCSGMALRNHSLVQAAASISS
jgi:hypothetical protein